MISSYICKFNFNGNEYWVESDSFIELKDGFWITETYSLSVSNKDKKYWIPPATIKYITKENHI